MNYFEFEVLETVNNKLNHYRNLIKALMAQYYCFIEREENVEADKTIQEIIEYQNEIEKIKNKYDLNDLQLEDTWRP